MRKAKTAQPDFDLNDLDMLTERYDKAVKALNAYTNTKVLASSALMDVFEAARLRIDLLERKVESLIQRENARGDARPWWSNR